MDDFITDVMLDFETLNKLLNKAYDLGRENENRMERGIPELDPVEEFNRYIKAMSRRSVTHLQEGMN